LDRRVSSTALQRPPAAQAGRIKPHRESLDCCKHYAQCGRQPNARIMRRAHQLSTLMKH
jgi:hypothetical protein